MVGQEYRVGCVRQVDIRQRQLYQGGDVLQKYNQLAPPSKLLTQQIIDKAKIREIESDIESTVEYSIAREALEVTTLQLYSNGNFKRKDNSGQIRKTNPMKNPFTQHSKSSAVLPTAQPELIMNNLVKNKASFPSAHHFFDHLSMNEN